MNINISRFPKLLSIILLIMLVIFSISLGAISTQAQITCDYTIPASDTTALINAIDSANGTPGAETICLTQSTYTVTAIHTTSNDGNLGFPLITSEITIEGNDSEITRNSADDFRFFQITAGSVVTLHDLTLSNGKLQDNAHNDGGAIHISGSTLNTDNVTFHNNDADDRAGGAIGALGSGTYANIVNSTFTNNQARTGGAIATPNANITITNSTFIGNSAIGTGSGGIGGVMYSSGTLTITDSTFTDNTAVRIGGALYLNASATITGSHFINNMGDEDASAIYTRSPLTITDSVFSSDVIPPETTYIISLEDFQGSVATLNMSNSCLVGAPNRVAIDHSGVGAMIVENNWWGASDGPQRGDIGGGVLLSSHFDYEPFLSSPPFPECIILPPIVTDDDIFVVYNTATPITLHGRGGLHPYTFSNVSTPNNGVLTGTSPSFTYTPNVDFVGVDVITYTVTDDDGQEIINTINLTIDTDFIPTDQDIYTSFNTPVNFTIGATGGIPPYVFDNVSTPSNGQLSGTLPNFTYTPNPDFTGTEIVTFDGTDDDGFLRTGTMTIHVADDLVVDDQYLYVSEGEPLDVAASLTGGREAYSYSTSVPTNGVLTGNGPSYQYTVNNGFSGLDSFVLTVTDANGDSDTGTIYLSATPPLDANSFTQQIPYETAFLVPLGAVGGTEPYSFSIIDPPFNGVISGELPNAIYTPNDEFTGFDEFLYQVTDANNYTSIGLVTLNVGEPLVTSDLELATQYRQAVNVLIQTTGGMQPFTYDVSTPTGGVVTGTAPLLIYMPNNDFGGTDNFTVTITDAGNNSVVSTVTVEVGVPLATEDMIVNVNYETATNIEIPVSDGLPPYSYDVSTPSNGVLTGTAPNLTYTPDNNFSGQDTFTVTITDDFGHIEISTVTLNVSTPVSVGAGDVTGLIAAINTANANGVPDTIILAGGTYNFTAYDNHSYNGSTGNNALPLITSEIAIRGNNAIFERDINVSGMRFFVVTLDASLTIDEISFINGWSRFGGAIWNHGGHLIVRNSAFTDNYANESGGAINFAGSNDDVFRVENTTFSGNTADNGGAITYTGGKEGNIIDSSFVNNATAVGNGTSGGAIYVIGDNLTIQDSDFSGNDSAIGSAVLADANLTIIGSHFTNNLSSYAVRVMSNRTTIYDSIFEDNLAGIFVWRDYWGGPRGYLTIENTCFSGNNPALASSNDLTTFGGETNWWGAFDGPSGIENSGGGDPIGDDINVFNFLTAPPSPDCPVLSPIPHNDTVNVLENSSVDFTLSAYGGLPPYTFADISDPAHGTISGAAPNLTYTPDANYIGDDSFTFSVTNSTGESAIGEITVNVLGTLTSETQAYTIDANSGLDFTLNSQTGLPPYTFDAMTQPQNGIVVGIGDSYTYIPNFEFSGVDTFTYTTHDATNVSVVHTVNVTVNQLPSTIVVDTLIVESPVVDNGNCSITEAILAANYQTAYDNCPAGSYPALDVIQLPAGTFTLTEALHIDVNVLGNVLIRGAGMDETIIQGMQNIRNPLFELNGPNITIAGMTLRGGEGENSRFGGALYIDGASDIVVHSVRFEDNEANDRGGAIFVDENNRLTIYNSAFRYNTSSLSGAVYGYNDAGITIINSAFKHNIGNGSFPDTVISYNPDSRANFNCVLDNRTQALALDNFAYNYWDYAPWDSPLYDAGRPDICDLVDAPEVDVADGDVQGLIDAIEYGNTFTFRESGEEFVINLATDGVYNFTAPYDGSPFGIDALLLPPIGENIHIEGNNAIFTKNPLDEARFLMVESDAELRVLDLTLENGYATEHGGAIYSTGRLEVVRSEFINNRTSSSPTARGGAIYANEGHLQITRSVLANNYAYEGGAIYTHNTNFYIATTTFIGNDSGGFGSSLSMFDDGITLPASLTLRENCFASNTGISVYTAHQGMVDAEGNWWNAVTGPSGAGTGSGDAVSSGFDFEPFLTEIPANQLDTCFPSLVANTQNFSMSSFDDPLDIVVMPDGGIPPYTYDNLTSPNNGVVSGIAPNLSYAVDAGFNGVDNFTIDVTDSSNETVTNTIVITVTGTTIVVDSYAQEIPLVTNGNCTLAEAIEAANTDTAVDACPAGNGRDIIELPTGTFILSEIYLADINGGNGLPIITSDIAINGNGATITRNDAEGTPQFRFFKVAEEAGLELYDLTLNNGSLYSQNYDTDHGGAIFAIGALTLDTVTLTNNQAYYQAGAVGVYYGDTLIINSVFEGNYSASGGALVFCNGVLEDTLIQNNSAERGGGLRLCGVDTAIVNSTIINNTATANGGQIYYTATNATITDSLIAYDLPDYPYTSSLLYGDNLGYRLTISESCLLYDGSRMGIVTESRVNITAENNWWGSITGPGIGTKVDTNVTYEPFYTAPVNGCPIFTPTAIDQTQHTPYETAINVDSVQAVDGVLPYAYVVGDPENGVVTGTAPDALVYTPNAGFSGTDFFDVVVTDDNNDSETARVTIHVSPQLLAIDQQENTTYETPLNFILEPNGGRAPYQYSNFSVPTNGVLSGTAPYQTYTPNNDFTGEDSFTFDYTDADGSVSTGTVTINVGGVVVADNQTVNTFEDTAVGVILTASNGVSPYTYGNFSDPAHGAIVQTSGASYGYIIYIPDTGYTGVDSFTFEATDSTATTSIGTVTVNITTNIVNIPDGNANALVNAITVANASGVPTAINLTPDSTYSLSDTDLLPAITSEMVIYGNGATIQRQSGTHPIFSAGNGGQLTLNQVTLSAGLTALQNNGGTVLVTQSTITAMSDAGIQNVSGVLNVLNSTLSNNVGGGIVNGTGAVANISSTTIAENSTNGGVNNTVGTLTLTNTILDDNTPQNCVGTVDSDGGNISSDNSCNLNDTGDQNNLDAMLQPLSANGGPTSTHGLDILSPAIDNARGVACDDNDQRGAQRNANSCDIGAFEVAIVPMADLVITQTHAPSIVLPNNVLTYTLTITNNGANTATNLFLTDMLPTNVTFDSATATTGTGCDFISGEVLCDLGNLNTSQSSVVTINLTVNGDATELTNEATVLAVEDDPDLNNNTTSDTISLIEPLEVIQVAPEGAITEGLGVPEFMWTHLSTIEEYTLWVGNSAGTRTISETISASIYCADGLCKVTLTDINPNHWLANDTYSWWLQPTDDGVAGAWIGAMNFSVSLAVPTVPTITDVTDLTTRFPTIEWTLSDNATLATAFNVWVGQVSSGAVINTTVSRIEACGTLESATCSFQSPNALVNADFTLYLQAIGAGGSSEWTAPYAFSINAPTLGQISGLSTSGSLTTPPVQPTYTWTHDPTTTWYQVQLNNTAGTVFNTWYQVGTDLICDDICSITPTQSLSNGEHTWWVAGWNSVDGNGQWSDADTFTVAMPAPSQPTGLSTIGSLTTPPVQPSYTWTHDPNSTWYQVQLNSATGVVFSTWYEVGNGVTCGATCSITPPNVLSNGEYIWWVQGYNAVGTSAWSDGDTFTVAMLAPFQPTGLTTVGSLTTPPVQPSYTWTHDPNSTWYQVQLNSATGVVFSTWYEVGNGVTCDTTCSIIPPNVLSNGEYTWWVQGYNAVGTSAWSDGDTFTVAMPAPSQPTGLTTVGSLTTPPVQPSYTWTHDPNSTWYQVQLNSATGAVFSTWYEVGNGVTCGATCSITPSNVLSNGNYTWWVQGYNVVGTSAWSDGDTFTVAITP